MSFNIKDLPCYAIKTIISMMIQNIKDSNDIKKIIEFLGLSKFLNEFAKDTIKEIYEVFESKGLIKKEITESYMDSKKKLQACLYENNCQICDKYVERNDDDYEKVVYYKDINDYICGSCAKDMSISCYSAVYKYKISNSILKDMNFFIHEEKDYSREMIERKFYFIKSIEKKINMSLHEYIVWSKKNKLDIVKKNKYYALKAIKKIVEEEKEYDFDFFTKYCMSVFNEYDMMLFDLNNPFDTYITTSCISVADIIYNKIIDIKNNIKTKKYSIEFVMDVITKDIKILKYSADIIVCFADEEYAKTIGN